MKPFNNRKGLTEIVKHRRIHLWVENLGYVTVTRKALFKACDGMYEHEVGVNCKCNGMYEHEEGIVKICF
jgi:hypothetical protein